MDLLLPKVAADKAGAYNLPLVGGPHDGAYLPCCLEDLELGQYYPLPGHAPYPGAPVYAPSAFYVIEAHEGLVEAVYSPNFNPYEGEGGQ